MTRPRTVVVRSIVAVSAVGVGLALTGIAKWGQTTQSFVVERFEVRGNVVLTDEEVQEFSGVDIGSNLMSASISDIEFELTSWSRVDRAQASRSLPDRVVVNLEEKLPAAFVILDNETVEVADDGTLLPPVKNTPFVDLPVITGVRSSLKLGVATDSDEVMKALKILRAARNVSLGLWKEISEIRIAPESGLVLFTLADGAEVRVGSGASDPRLLRRLWTVICDLRAAGQEVEHIDLTFRDQVVVRKR